MYMDAISKKPEIIEKMKKNMAKNKNDKAMEKLYKITLEHLKD